MRCHGKHRHFIGKTKEIVSSQWRDVADKNENCRIVFDSWRIIKKTKNSSNSIEMKSYAFVISVFLLVLGCDTSDDSMKKGLDNQQSSKSGTFKFSVPGSGLVPSENDPAIVTTSSIGFKHKYRLEKIHIKQDPQWNTWKSIPRITPDTATEAPVFIPISKGNYWMLARYSLDHSTGYHSWHSVDMENWKHYGPVSSLANRWVTSAEYLDGKFYIYFDKPNDEDPHLIIDEDLTDGKQGMVMGRVLNDPTHGSDSAVFRDDDGTFHLIYEDWTPINPQQNSWDSPLAGHADSPDGINGFEPHELPYPIDERTNPTGVIRPYRPDPNQLVHGPDQTPYVYEVHVPDQNAYGDYTLIKIGQQYYLFCDYDSHEQGKSLRVGRWRSDDINKEFVWDGEIGEGFHPDPSVGFAEDKFYLIVQRTNQTFISNGPWVDGIEMRAGVDTDDDGVFDQWTEFVRVKERYAQKSGFVRVVEKTPAILQNIDLPEGYRFQIEIRRTNDRDGFFPNIESLTAQFDGLDF